MTSNNQIRSVVMTLLMVTSVFAGAVAFTGTAAASIDGASVSPSTVQQGNEATITVNYNNGTNETLFVYVSNDSTLESSDTLVADGVTGNEDNTSQFTWTAPSGVNANGTYTVFAASNETGSAQPDLASFTSAATIEVAQFDDDAGDVKFVGQEAVFQLPSGDYELYRATDGTPQFVSELTQNDDTGLITVDTSGRQTGTYYVRTDPGQANPGAQFQLAEQELSATFDPANVTNAEVSELTLDSNRNEYNVSVSADGLDADELETIFGGAGSITNADEGTYEINLTSQNANVEANFTGIEAGEYDFQFDAVDTDASASDQVNVSEIGSKGASFQPNVISEQVGDVAAITVNLENSNTAEVSIGTNESVSYKFNATVTDGNGDGNVTLLFNTYLAGQGDSEVVTTLNEDDTVDVNLNPTLGDNGQPIAPGDYPLSVSIGGQEQNVGTLVLNQRSTDSISVWTAPAQTDISNAEDVYSSVTNNSEIAQGDKTIIQVQASGLYGYLEDFSNLNGSGANGLTLQVTRTNAPPNSPTASFYANETIIPDSENNTFFAVVDTADLAAGGEYEATFAVNGSANPYVAAGETESVSTTFTVVQPEADFTFQGEQLTLGGSEAQLSGTTNLAPGTEVNLRVQSNSNANPFLKTATATVNQDGTFNATFDMSGIPQDTEFTASIGSPNAISDVSETGVVGESTQPTTGATTTGATTTAATTTAATTTSGTTETTTPQPTTTTTTDGGNGGGDTQNGQGQPGFGIVAALIALIAAALIAVRRD